MLESRDGLGVLASKPHARKWTPREVARARDLAMLAMKRQGVPLMVIAAVFNIDRKTVRRRLQAMPAKAKDHYAARGLV